MTKFQKQMMTIAAIGALSAVTALPAMAADITPYGSARLTTFWNINEKSDAVGAGLGGTNQGYDEHLQTNARFGVDFKNGEITGKAEFGVAANAQTGTGTTATDNAVALRLLYGAWDFGSGKLVVGKDYNRYYTFVTQVAKNEAGGLNGIGSLWDGRAAQLRVDMKNGLYISFIEPTGNVANNGYGEQESITATNTTSKEAQLPKVNIGYAGKAGAATYNIGAVAQTYRLKNTATTVISDQVTSALGYLNGAVVMGDTKVMYNVSYGMNPAEMGFSGRLARGTANGSDDVMGFEGYLQLTQKLSPSLSVNIGTGYVYDRGENATANGKITEDKLAAYINLPITLAKNVTVVPEFYYEDQFSSTYTTALVKTSGKSQMYQVGAKWQIDF